ncbi:beta-lactamase [Salinisphaera sp. PC39]|uniref:serine hydrolase domain-containing protein n=1 Tax=Salinisphaera sp. PC39 TaxID=1304156 RepID=UPI003340722C
MLPPRRRLDDPDTIRDAYAGRLWPDEQVRVFANTDRMFPTRTVACGERVRPLPASRRSLDGFVFESGGATYDLYDYLSRNRIAGLLVLKDGEVVLERYELGVREDTRWMSMSMAKSISSTLVGAAIRDGYIDSVDDPLVRYVPELKRGAYSDVTVRQLLRMSSGARWNESQTDPVSERRRVLELQIAQQPATILQYMAGLPKEAPAGRRWNYSTGETHIVGVLLRAATGAWLADYLSERIWSRAGMQADAAWWLEAPEGLEIAGSGLSATLRDYARFGQFMLEGGVADNRPVLPDAWVAEAGDGYAIDGEPIPYGYMWWPVPAPGGEPGCYNGFSARGIFGQRLHINPAHGLVIAMASARSKPMYSETITDNDFFNAVSKAL